LTKKSEGSASKEVNGKPELHIDLKLKMDMVDHKVLEEVPKKKSIK